MEFGTVALWIDDRGFGFITPDRAASDIFVHCSIVRAAGLPQLKRGERVMFETKRDEHRGKLQITKIELVG